MCEQWIPSHSFSNYAVIINLLVVITKPKFLMGCGLGTRLQLGMHKAHIAHMHTVKPHIHTHTCLLYIITHFQFQCFFFLWEFACFLVLIIIFPHSCNLHTLAIFVRCLVWTCTYIIYVLCKHCGSNNFYYQVIRSY